MVVWYSVHLVLIHLQSFVARVTGKKHGGDHADGVVDFQSSLTLPIKIKGQFLPSILDFRDCPSPFLLAIRLTRHPTYLSVLFYDSEFTSSR